MSAAAYMDLYSLVYHYCSNTQSSGYATKTPIKPTTKPGSNNRQNNIHDGANIVGGELYTILKNDLKSNLEKICK
ncbi:unnamed protein product, partial [Rotaria sordida]